MASIPVAVQGLPKIQESDQSVEEYLTARGRKLWNRGKVRDTYTLPGKSKQLVVVATDRISIFDFVLPVTIPLKGEVLTALSHFWMTTVLKEWTNHLIPSEFVPEFNAAYDLSIRNGAEFPLHRTLVVKRLEMEPFELIFRQHPGGSIWKEYLEKGTISGVPMPVGLQKWAKYPVPIFTPSTKAKVGHDENITVKDYFKAMGRSRSTYSRIDSLQRMYSTAYDYASSRGILILDTKLEIGVNGVLADEVLTPDSSRFTTVEDLQLALAEKHDPIFYDKEPVRIWGRGIETEFGVKGINKLDSSNEDHVAFVSNLQVPSQIIDETSQRYVDIFRKLTGEDLGDYQRRAMGV